MDGSTKLHRRTILRGSAAVLALGISGISRSLLALQQLDSWPQAAFESKTLDQALRELVPQQPETSDLVYLNVPNKAINGAVVPVRVTTALGGVRSIALLVTDNPQPLVAQVSIVPGVRPIVSTRIKMNRSSHVVALVETSDGFVSGRKYVEVANGGCLN